MRPIWDRHGGGASGAGRAAFGVTPGAGRARSRAAAGKSNGEQEKPMTIKVGDTIPSMKLMMATPEGPKETSTDDIFKGKKVVLFAVPGAFTPTCSAKHLPGFVQNAEAIKGKGVDTIACISVNDAFVMGAWGKDQGTDGKVTMLADGAAQFAKALGLELDLNARGMGIRSQRYALVAQDAKVTHVAVEAPGGFEVSKAEAILASL
jgi:peroxiredoxin (alkyl hydroperoxide reductase subunit C)